MASTPLAFALPDPAAQPAATAPSTIVSLPASTGHDAQPGDASGSGPGPSKPGPGWAAPSRQTLPHGAPTRYVQRFAMEAMWRRGFEGAEAGAMAEVERLMEMHMLRLFQSAKEYAELANRLSPNASDVLAAQDEARASRKLQRESKRRRIAMTIPQDPSPPSPPAPRTLDLLIDFATYQDPRDASIMTAATALPGPGSGPVPATPATPAPATPAYIEDRDRKPDLALLALGELAERDERTGAVPTYAYNGAPGLPPIWTRVRLDEAPPENSTAEPKAIVTAGSLEFVRKSASTGDIPPELGIVNYRMVQGKSRAGRWGRGVNGGMGSGGAGRAGVGTGMPETGMIGMEGLSAGGWGGEGSSSKGVERDRKGKGSVGVGAAR